jgi:WD40-like Beta Propeller Repeat
MDILEWRLCSTIALVMAAGCSNDSVVPTEPPGLAPHAIEAVSPVTIVGIVDRPVSQPPSVRVIDQRGKPLSGVIVGFQTEHGIVAVASSPTNANGIATPQGWKLGTQSGLQYLSANVAGLPPFLFTASAAAGPMTQIRHVGDEQASRPGTAIADPVSVWLSDRFNNPVPGQPVTFTILSGTGTLERDSATTGPDGIASPGIWTLGSERGPQHVKARVAANSNRWEVLFTAHACDNPGPSGCADVPASCVSANECGEIAFVSSRDGQAEIYSVNRDGTGLTRLTNNPAADWDPSWSPDGKRIAFVSDRSSYPEIYVMNADGSNVVRRTFFANSSSSPSWSPDGTRILFAAGSSTGMTLWTVSDVGEAGPTRFLQPGLGAILQPHWSPDGRVAFSYNVFDEDWAIATTDGEGSGFNVVTDPFFFVSHPSWSRSGSRIAVAYYGAGGAQLGVMNPTGSALQPLIATGLFSKSTWSPDDKLIAFASGTASARNLMWIKADGSESGLIVTNGWNPDWRR